jgi:ribonuclease P protein subunit RPR2
MKYQPMTTFHASGHIAMAKASNKAGIIPNKVLYSRISYLHQAASYLATQQQHSSGEYEQITSLETQSGKENEVKSCSTKTLQPMSRQLISDVRNVSQKTKIQMSPAKKSSICKYCDTVLIEGSTCSSEVENKSKGGKKPWADVFVRKCNTCGLSKRVPMAKDRQKRRPNRSLKVADE